MASAGPRSSVLALNCGSSSLKFGLYRVESSIPKVLLSGEAESIGDRQSKFWAKDANDKPLVSESANFGTQQDAVARIATLLAVCKEAQPVAVGHRVVHGGAESSPPLPGRRNGAAAARSGNRLRATAQSSGAVSHSLRAGALPAAATSCLLRHGVSRWDARCRAHPADPPRNAIGWHTPLWIPRPFLRVDHAPTWGQSAGSANNCASRQWRSLTAVKGGQSIDTSMGLTPTGGVIMGTRCGDLDPGVLVFLVREKNFDAARLEALVDHHSGLLGISGIDSDMRRLHEVSPSNADARLAIEMFCYSIRKQVAAMIAALDGVDLLVFTGGIGENDAKVRAEICGGLSWLGISLDTTRNHSLEDPISNPTSRCSVRVLPSEEDAQVATHTWELASGIS